MTDSPLNDIRIGEISSQWAKGCRLPSRYEKSTTSTNDLAKEEAFAQAAEETVKVYFTEEQSNGRGRGANSWTNPPAGSALLSSWSFALQDPPHPTLTPRLGLALVRALSGTWSFLPWSLKAPNDIYLGSKKVAGLLTETVSQGPDVRLILGLGINVLASPDSVETATHLTDSLPDGAPLLGEDWIGFLERWMFELSGVVAMADDQELTSTERRALVDFMNRRPKAAKVEDVLADGGLVIGGITKPWMEI